MPVIGSWRKISFLSLALGAPIGGCSTVGPVSIDQGRTPYNEVIQTTSEQQTLLNLVRVSKAETPLFMDVTEVDATSMAQVNVSGTESGLGSILNRGSPAGTLASSIGAVTAGAQYQEAPTIRYQPLLGAALVAQVSTPVSATSLVNLYNSGWPLGSIFDLAVTRFTPGFDDYHAAVNALMALDRYGALVLEAKPSGQPEAARLRDTRVDVTVGQQPAKEDANLVIYFRPDKLRYRFRECEDGRDQDFDDNKKKLKETQRAQNQRDVEEIGKKLWLRVLGIFEGRTSMKDLHLLVLSTKSEAGPSKDPVEASPPLLQTRSALGMLNVIASGDNLVAFSSKERVDDVIAKTFEATGDAKGTCHQTFYRAGSSDEVAATAYENKKFTSIDGGDQVVLGGKQLNDERVFGDDRRLILVEVTGSRPADAFVSVFHKDAWYSVQDRDLISKRNLALVAQIATIQAVAPQAARNVSTTLRHRNLEFRLDRPRFLEAG